VVRYASHSHVRNPKTKQIVDALKVSAPADLKSSTRLVDFVLQNRLGDDATLMSSQVITIQDGSDNVRGALLYTVTDEEVNAYVVVVPTISKKLQETVVDLLFDHHLMEDLPSGVGFHYAGYVF